MFVLWPKPVDRVGKKRGKAGGLELRNPLQMIYQFKVDGTYRYTLEI